MVQLQDIKKGLFITQTDYPDSFAIMADEVYVPTDSDVKQELLLCYYNPTHFELDEDGKWKKGESIFSIEFGDDTCEYGIDHEDLKFWRKCTDKEIESVLKFLAEKRIAFDDKRCDFRKMNPNEVINFGDRPTTQTNPAGYSRGEFGGGTRNNPYYQGYSKGETEPRKKYITRNVDENWEQKMPITVMTVEHRELVLKQCDKLKWSFSSTSYGHEGYLPYSAMLQGCYDGDYYD